MTDVTPPVPTAPVPTVTPQVESHTIADVSASEAATLAKWTREDLAAGKISSAQAETITRAGNPAVRAERGVAWDTS